jgi:predicted TIM-barrel fold metal-dependent hydrolase
MMRCYDPAVIVDCHTHIFPPEIATDRDHYLDADATFRELYADPRAKLATAGELIASMERSGIDVSVALGFAWTDVETCRLHNDYLLEAGHRNKGRIVPFCSLPLAGDDATIEAEARRCTQGGAAGFGEMRPENNGFDLLQRGDVLARLADELDAVLLFHVSEPVGHRYAGKGGLAMATFYEFVCAHPGIKVIGAHWAGGLPFYGPMPEVREVLGRIHVDTAASSLLYDDSVYERVNGLAGSGSVLFGSDYPLLSQSRSRRRIEESSLAEASKSAILGSNAALLLGLG